MENTINSEELLDRVAGDRVLLSELLEIFAHDWPAQIEAARGALARAEPEGVERAGHSLKGTLANLAATGACRLAARVEDIGRSRRLDEAKSVLMELEQELGRVTDSLALLCQGGACEDSHRR
jgi:HPt (histidine-containing phosphotransfer) domain-containing protein